MKRRCIHQGACDGHPKYKNDEGASQHLFNAQTLLDAERVVVVEGELDAICVEQLGVPAVGFPGADTWRANSRVWRWCFDSVLEVVVVADGDLPRDGREIGVGEEAARSVAESLRSSLPDLDVRTVVLPVGMDANSYIHQEGGMAFLEKIGWL